MTKAVQSDHIREYKHLMVSSLMLNVFMLLMLLFQKNFEHNPLLRTKDCCQCRSCFENKSDRSEKCYSSHQSADYWKLRHEYDHEKSSSANDFDQIIDLDHGDPTMFERFWLENGDLSKTVIFGWERVSYFASRNQFWFVEQELDKQIRALHYVVGNAVTDGRYIIVGTGSTQLFQAALYAVSYDPSRSDPVSVYSGAPFYSSYPAITDYLKSSIYKWAGDALQFEPEGKNQVYVELVTSPNNPDGSIRSSLIKNGSGSVIYDLAYYWPHYTPITEAADHDIMLFTVSKCTGHAGTRIGWAIVKSLETAKKMMKFIELNTIGVSHDAQIRTANILRSINSGYGENPPHFLSKQSSGDYIHDNKLFHFGYLEMQLRWKKLRDVVKQSNKFSLPDANRSFCSFFGQTTTSNPAFAWLRCNDGTDCQLLLKEKGGIISRSGTQFGADWSYVRISMLDKASNFEMFVRRLATIARPSEEL